MKRRNDRQEAIKWIVRNNSIRTQRDLVNELCAQGFSCTQATASRDIADMGLRKLPEGVYVLAEDLHLQRMVAEFVVEVAYAMNTVVIKTQPGTAPGVAAAVDAADLEQVLGTVAGNDTVFAVTHNQAAAAALAELMNKLHDVGRD